MVVRDITYCSNEQCERKALCARSLHKVKIPEDALLSVFDGVHCEKPQDVENKYMFYRKKA